MDDNVKKVAIVGYGGISMSRMSLCMNALIVANMLSVNSKYSQMQHFIDCGGDAVLYARNIQRKYHGRKKRK